MADNPWMELLGNVDVLAKAEQDRQDLMELMGAMHLPQAIATMHRQMDLQISLERSIKSGQIAGKKTRAFKQVRMATQPGQRERGARLGETCEPIAAFLWGRAEDKWVASARMQQLG